MTVKFRVTHSRAAPKAKRYRYALVARNGQTLSSGEGYPTHQHVTRAIEGLWKALAKLFGYGTVKDATRAALSGESFPPIPYTADSLQPGQVAATATRSKTAAAAPKRAKGKVADIALRGATQLDDE